jgi:hypothetical protein
MSWPQWLVDWYGGLRALGYSSRNVGIGPTRKSVTAKVVSRQGILYMQKDDHGVHLYPSVEGLPRIGGCEYMLTDKSTVPSSVTRIVQGRRRDSSRGVEWIDGDTAKNIIPKMDITGLKQFYVEFDGSLFEPDKEGGWRKATEPGLLALYCEYRVHSPHYQAIRPYRKGIKECPTGMSVDLETLKTDDAIRYLFTEHRQRLRAIRRAKFASSPKKTHGLF